MKKVFDLSSYLQEEKATIKLGNDTYEINDGFNDMLKVDALSSRKDELSTTDFVKEFLKVTLGEEAALGLIGKNYPTKVYIKIMNCIQEAYSGDSDEDTEEGFQPTLV